MKSKDIISIYFAVIAILMYNGFLIKRDQKMFQKYEHERAIHQPVAARNEHYHGSIK